MVRRILLFTFAVFVGLAVAGGGYLLWSAKRAEPDYSGQVSLGGLAAPVTVRFGPHAVPSIEADSLEDLLFAQGYIVASERMWQMDLMRRLASGHLAEVLGEEALAADRFFRTLGLARLAQQSLDALGEPYDRYLKAYAGGVNAYQAEARGRLPLEYLIAGFEPSPWRPQDSLVIGEYMSWTLSFNLREELVFLRLASRVGIERALELFPTDEGVPAPDYARGLPTYTASAHERLGELVAMPARWGLPVPGAASNAWAVNGERTEDGRALLANDPHLAPTMPAIWYELELKAPSFHVTGASLPGLPFVLIGHNEDLAWGFTTVMADTQDLFVERITADGTHVQRPEDEQEPIRSRTEKIEVKGWSTPEQLTIRSTSKGVVLNDVLGANTGTPMDLSQVDTAHLLVLHCNADVPERATAGMYRLNRATTLEEARSAILDLKHASQNLMAAHRDGGIAWQVSGALPLRAKGLGTFPSPGWDAGYNWVGYVPSEQNPGLTNPPGYALLSANNRTIPLDHEVQVTRSWMAPYRARRIEELLGARNPLRADDLANMQLDRISLQARRFHEALGRVAPQIRDLDPEARRIADEYLMTWDGGFEGDSRAAALFILLERALFVSLFGDELGEDLPALMSIAILSYNALEEALYSGRSSFWDDIGTPQKEGPAHVWARALRTAKKELDRELPDPQNQRLDNLRQLVFPHAFDRIPVLGRLFSVGPIGVGGDSHTLNLMKASPQEPEKVLFVPSYRVVYTPADWSETRGTLPLGQSGHRLSPYRTDQLQDWLEGRAHRWLWNGPEPGTEIGVFVLRPEP
ncbi:MAG: penicillin acylase family protein [Pseudomonadota bacterium]|nr:penicillin acylase family protein [Pseudomonadota bacterium]